MGKEEKKRAKAELAIAKAERLMDNENFKKAAEQFQKGGELFFELGEWRIAEKSFFYAGKCYIKIEKYRNAAHLQRLAANCCLLLHDFSKARDYYDVAFKSYLRSESKDKDEMAALTMSFAFLCHFILGQQDEALNYIKRFKKKIDSTVFNEHPLINLTRNLANAIINQKEKYLEEVFEEYPKFRFRAAEAELINAAILVAMCSVYMKYSLNLTTVEFDQDKVYEINTKINLERVEEIETHPIVPHKFKSIKVIDMGIAVSDNLGIKKKPDFPIEIYGIREKEYILPIKLRTNFPGEGYIGPILITVQIDGKFNFFLKTGAKNIKILSPRAVLEIQIKPLKTPIVNQTFPVQIELSNNSEGDAQEIEVEFEFTEDMRLMRGTPKKTIYALSPNEHIQWQLHLKAFDVGEIPIKTVVKFKDGNGREKGPFEAELPIEINM